MPLVKAIETGTARSEFASANWQVCGLTLYDSRDKPNILERMAKEGDSPVEVILRAD